MFRKTTFVIGALVGAAALASGCASMHQTSSAANAVPASLSAAEISFLTNAAGSDLYEIEASQMALARGSSARVKAHAQMLVSHHARSGNALKDLLAAKGVTPPATLPPDKQAKLAQLSRLQGAALDREYIRVTGVQDHQAALAIFEQASRTLADADLRGFAARTVPVLRQHLQAAQSIASGMAG